MRKPARHSAPARYGDEVSRCTTIPDMYLVLVYVYLRITVSHGSTYIVLDGPFVFLIVTLRDGLRYTFSFVPHYEMGHGMTLFPRYYWYTCIVCS